MQCPYTSPENPGFIFFMQLSATYKTSGPFQHEQHDTPPIHGLHLCRTIHSHHLTSRPMLPWICALSRTFSISKQPTFPQSARERHATQHMKMASSYNGSQKDTPKLDPTSPWNRNHFQLHRFPPFLCSEQEHQQVQTKKLLPKAIGSTRQRMRLSAPVPNGIRPGSPCEHPPLRQYFSGTNFWRIHPR